MNEIDRPGGKGLTEVSESKLQLSLSRRCRQLFRRFPRLLFDIVLPLILFLALLPLPGTIPAGDAYEELPPPPEVQLTLNGSTEIPEIVEPGTVITLGIKVSSEDDYEVGMVEYHPDQEFVIEEEGEYNCYAVVHFRLVSPPDPEKYLKAYRKNPASEKGAKVTTDQAKVKAKKYGQASVTIAVEAIEIDEESGSYYAPPNQTVVVSITSLVNIPEVEDITWEVKGGGIIVVSEDERTIEFTLGREPATAQATVKFSVGSGDMINEKSVPSNTVTIDSKENKTKKFRLRITMKGNDGDDKNHCWVIPFTGEEWYDEGEGEEGRVDLRAGVKSEGRKKYKFASWSGDATGVDGETYVTMNQHRNVTANFSPIEIDENTEE